MNRKEKKVLVKDLVTRILSILGDLKTVKDFSIKSTKTLIDVSELAVSLVEHHSNGISKLSGKEKKEIATMVLNEFINIKVKFIPRRIMEKIEGYMISLAIETIVNLLNKKLGKAWLQG